MCQSSVSVSVILNYTLQRFCVRYRMVSALLGQNIHCSNENDIIVTFLPPVSVMDRVKFCPLRIWSRVDGRGYTDADRCSLADASQWFHTRTRTWLHGNRGVAWLLWRTTKCKLG